MAQSRGADEMERGLIKKCLKKKCENVTESKRRWKQDRNKNMNNFPSLECEVQYMRTCVKMRVVIDSKPYYKFCS